MSIGAKVNFRFWESNRYRDNTNLQGLCPPSLSTNLHSDRICHYPIGSFQILARK